MVGHDGTPPEFDVLRVVDGRIAEITMLGPHLFAQCGLPETLSD
jgi:hypothetical protein